MSSAPSPTDDPRYQFGHQFVLLARHWRRVLDHELTQIGLTDAVWAPLIHLHRDGDGILQRELALRVGIDGSTLVRVLDILCERDLIERRADPTDRRAKRLFLTAKGRDAVAEIQHALSAAEAQLLHDVGDEELAQVMRVMAKIGARVQALSAEQHASPS